MNSRKQSYLLSPVGSPASDNESGLAATASGGSRYGRGGDDSPAATEQDRFLPIANVSRIMKRSLPGSAKVSKEAKETVQECVSEFISLVTGEACDKCQREKRKTINGDDLLWAMATLGFEAYVEPLKAYLNLYREVEVEKAAVGVSVHHGNNEDARSSLSSVMPHGAGDRGGASGVAEDGDVRGVMMGVNVGFSAGTGTRFHAAATAATVVAHGRGAYGTRGLEFQSSFGGDHRENDNAGGERGFAGHLHGV